MSNKNIEPKQQQVAISRRKLMGEVPIVVNEITNRCLYSGFFGTMDSARMKKTIDGVLAIVASSDNDLIIIDLSNMEVIDSVIAMQLVKLNRTLQLVGMDTIFCGIKPIVAQSMVSAGLQLENIYVAKNLKRALLEVYRRQGLKLMPIRKE